MDFSKALPALILAGPSGMAVSTRGRPRPQQVVAYWPALMRRDGVSAKVLTFDTDCSEHFQEIHFPVRGDVGEPVPSDEPSTASAKPRDFTGPHQGSAAAPPVLRPQRRQGGHLQHRRPGPRRRGSTPGCVAKLTAGGGEEILQGQGARAR